MVQVALAVAAPKVSQQSAFARLRNAIALAPRSPPTAFALAMSSGASGSDSLVPAAVPIVVGAEPPDAQLPDAAPPSALPPDVGAADDPLATLFKRMEVKSKKYFKCLTCSGQPIKEKTHFAARSQAAVHQKKDLSPEEKAEWVRNAVDDELSGPEARERRVQAEVARVRAAQVAAEDSEAERAARDERSQEQEAEPYKIRWGGFKGKTIDLVMRLAPTYFASFVQQTKRGREPFETQELKPIKEELIKQGLWEKVLADGRDIAAARRAKTVEQQETGEAQKLHPNVHALHRINLQRALEEKDEAPLQPIVAASVVAAPTVSRRSRKFVRSRAEKHVKQCLLCGKHGCVTSKCPLRTDMERLLQEEQRLKELAVLDPTERRRRKLIAHLKYVNLSQRSKAYENRKRASRTAISRSFSELDRATPGGLAVMIIEDGPLQSLTGAPCVSSQCHKYPDLGFLNARTLGVLRMSSRQQYSCVSIKSVFYRCITCSAKYAINRGSKVYPPKAGGYGPTERTLCYWNKVHGAPPLLTAKQLRLSEDTVKSYYRHASVICGVDALRRERAITFGGRRPLTTDIEIDEHAWNIHWTEGDRHCFLVWMAALERGAPEKLLMRPVISKDASVMPGVTYCEGPEGKVPPLSKECLEDFLNEANFGEETGAILMSDSALAYQNLAEGRWRGIVKKYLVNHSEKEWIRQELHIPASVDDDDTATDTRPGTAGTQTIDCIWKKLEAAIPETLNAPRDAASMQIWVEHIRFAQWLHFVGPSDKWAAFCEAAQRFEEASRDEKVAASSRPRKRKAAEAVGDLTSKSDAILDGCHAPENAQEHQPQESGQQQEHVQDQQQPQEQQLEQRQGDQQQGQLQDQREQRHDQQQQLAREQADVDAPQEAQEQQKQQHQHQGPEQQLEQRQGEQQQGQLQDQQQQQPHEQQQGQLQDQQQPHEQQREQRHDQQQQLAREQADVDAPEEAQDTHLRNPPVPDIASMLGYFLSPFLPDRMSWIGRGCVNLQLTHCYAISVLRSLYCLPRVQNWVAQHSSSCQRKKGDCVICMLNSDFDSLATRGDAFVPTLTHHRAAWSPAW